MRSRSKRLVSSGVWRILGFTWFLVFLFLALNFADVENTEEFFLNVILSAGSIVLMLWRWLVRERLKALVIIYCLAITLACVFVPWKAEVRGILQSYGYRSVGYNPIWSPPTSHKYSSVDLERVVLEIVALTALACVGFVLGGGWTWLRLGSKKKDGENLN